MGCNQRLIPKVRSTIRAVHYSYRTEHAYVSWVLQFVRFHDVRHPLEMDERHVAQFLTHIAVQRRVSASTQNQALSALVFLYRHVLSKPLEEIKGVKWAKMTTRIPVVLSRAEVAAVLSRLEHPYWLLAALMYGSGLRLMESLRLRIKDIDFEHRALLVRSGKGAKDHVVTLPEELVVPLQQQREQARLVHAKDLADGFGRTVLPYALERKYPNASIELAYSKRRHSKAGVVSYTSAFVCDTSA